MTKTETPRTDGALRLIARTHLTKKELFTIALTARANLRRDRGIDVNRFEMLEDVVDAAIEYAQG